MRKSDPLTLARYAQDKNLTNKTGWKWAKNAKTNIDRIIRKIGNMLIIPGKKHTPKGIIPGKKNTPDDIPGKENTPEDSLAKTVPTQTKRKPMKAKGPRFKFGVKIPRSTKHATHLDSANGNNLWHEAMEKETKGLLELETFKILESDERPSKGCVFIALHACYECKVDGRRKCCIVANGGMAPLPSDNDDLYSGVVSIDVVRL